MIAKKPLICAIGLAIGISAAAFADDYYVSSDGNYGIEEGADADHRFTDLQDAVTNAVAESTIWVEDGFVCDSGSYDYKTTKTTYHTRLYVGKKMTIRSKSGDWRTGAEIVGKYAETAAAAAETWIGNGALTCAYCAGKASVTFIGFRFTRGATYKEDANQWGGGVNGATLQNCLVANCAAGNYGGGMYACDSYDSTITNCHVFAGGSAYQLGGGAYNGTHYNDYFLDCHAAGSGGALNAEANDCVIEKCKAGYAGGIRGTGRRCTFIGCSSNNGGGAGYQATLYDCVITNCSTSAMKGSSAYNCLFVGNAANGNGSAFSFSGNTASNCVFRNNGSPTIAVLSTSTANKMIDCKVMENLGTGVQLAYSGGSGGSYLLMTNCVVEDIGSSSAAVYMQQQSAKTTTQTLNAYNCVLSGPVTGGNFYNCLIRGANSQKYPTVFCDSTLATYKGGTVPLNLYNCTVINNVSTYSTAGNVAGGYVNAYNTIIRDNTAPADRVDKLATAVNCCLSDTATAMTETDCIRVDPALYLGTGDYFYPSASSPCRTAGSLTAYELTPTDQAGQPRTSNGGTTVAIGACEFDPTFVGASIVCLPEITKAPATGKFTVTYSGLGENLTFSWDFNGDGMIDLVTNVATVAYYYPEAGDYRAKVAVSDGQKTLTAEQAMSILDGYFVSTKNVHEVPGRTGGWGVYTTDDGHEHLAYTNLQQAINDASAGDIVWVDNDFVCDEGTATPSSTYRITLNKTLTVRSKSGDWRTGPVIRGSYATGSDGSRETRCGAGAVRGVTGNGKDNAARLVGFRIERCATPASGTESGGGANNIILENCLVAGCGAYARGGGLNDVSAYSCVISNCTVYGAANIYGPAAYNATLYDCQILKNTGGTYGGGITGSKAYRCFFAGNKGGYGADACSCSGGIFDSIFTSSWATDGGHSTYMSKIVGCVVSNTTAESGSIIYRSSAYDCLFIGNKTTAWEQGTGYVASNCVFTGNGGISVRFSQNPSATEFLEDCTFSNNTATCVLVKSTKEVSGRVRNCTIDAPKSTAIKAEPYSASYNTMQSFIVQNCRISGNVVGVGELSNCLVANGTNSTGSTIQYQPTNHSEGDGELCLYNCTVTDNDTPMAATIGGGRVVAVNTIVKGNAPKDGLVDTFLAASNSCIEASAEVGDAYQCVHCNPRFMGTPGDEYVPRAAKLYGKGQIFDWMSDPDDVRSQDLAGKPRLHEGAVDMGAFAMYPLPGFLLLVR